MQETQIWSLVWEDATDQLNWATEPMHHNSCCRVQEKRREEKRSHSNQKRVQLESSPPVATIEKARTAMKTQHSQKEKFFPCITCTLNLAHLHRNHSVRVSALHESPVSLVNGSQLSHRNGPSLPSWPQQMAVLCHTALQRAENYSVNICQSTTVPKMEWAQEIHRWVKTTLWTQENKKPSNSWNNIISLNPFKESEMVCISSIFRWRHWSSKRLSSLAKVGG